MSLLKNLARSVRDRVTGRQSFTPAEVRELLRQRDFDGALAALASLTPETPRLEAERAALRGELLFQQRDDAGAVAAFKAALRLAPGMASAHYGLSLVLAEQHDLEDAVRHAFFAHSVDPNDPRFLAQVGYCHLQMQNYPLAEAPLRRATLLDPRNAYAWNNLGIVLHAKGRPHEALACFQRASTLNPDDTSAREHLELLTGMLGREPAADGEAPSPLARDAEGDRIGLAELRALEREGRLQEAIDRCEALALEHDGDPAYALALHGLHERAGDTQSGIDSLEAFMARHGRVAAVVAALGLSKLQMSDFRAAESALSEALAESPEEPSLLLGLAEALSGQERFAEAAPLLAQAVALAPEDVKGRVQLAVNLVNECRYEEGLAACRQLEAEGLHVPALGAVLAYMGRFDEAVETLDLNLAAQPNDPHLRFHRGSVRLLHLDFERGWDDYAARAFSSAKNFRLLPFPLWKGEPLAGRKIIVLAEQGLGDQVMFASCLPDLLATGPAEVVVEAIHRLAPTLQRSFPQCRVIGTGQNRQLDWLKDCEDMDFYVPMGDLPRHFRRSLAAFAPHQGFLVPAPERVAHWRRLLEESGPGPYIGFSWKGGTEGTRTSLRSLEPLSFEPLKRARPATWVCLQYGSVQAQVDAAAAAGFTMAYWPESIADLDEFAALVSALDLVITVCNTTVHYAGALGKPLWVLAPKVPEWRYGITNETLPWYPSSRMFRQRTAGEWEPVLEDIRQILSGPDGHAVRSVTSAARS